MRIVFAGTPEFASQALAALLGAGHEVPLVLTQPDRKAGRGLSKAASPVKVFALSRGLPLFQPETLNAPEAVETLRATAPDVMVVAAYGLILPQSVLSLPRLGALNIHASLLPRWRGAAPIQRALLAGDPETGITIMQMDAGLDTGPMLDRLALKITPTETSGSLHDKLALLGAQRIVAVLQSLERGQVSPMPQPSEGVTYARKIAKREAAIDWGQSATALDRVVRAFNPAPGAFSRFGDAEIKVWSANVVARQGEPGRVHAVDQLGIVVTCGEGALNLTELQRAGGRRLDARDFVSGFPITTGSRFALFA